MPRCVCVVCRTCEKRPLSCPYSRDTYIHIQGWVSVGSVPCALGAIRSCWSGLLRLGLAHSRIHTRGPYIPLMARRNRRARLLSWSGPSGCRFVFRGYMLVLWLIFLESESPFGPPGARSCRQPQKERVDWDSRTVASSHTGQPQTGTSRALADSDDDRFSATHREPKGIPVQYRVGWAPRTAVLPLISRAHPTRRRAVPSPGYRLAGTFTHSTLAPRRARHHRGQASTSRWKASRSPMQRSSQHASVATRGSMR